MSLSIGSLFSGIGGPELGLERAGLGPVLWQVESDPFCRRVLARHWPGAERHEDVCEVGSELAPVDLICGGFPCQDISGAGKGAGLAGARSGLWFEYLRIVRALRPRVVVVENVPTLASRGLGTVLGGLAESGYDAQWDCIPAASVGAPHRRDRLFVVAWRVSDSLRHPLRFEPERGPGAARSPDAGHTVAEHVGQDVGDANGDVRRPVAHTEEMPPAGGARLANPDSGRLEAERCGGVLDRERAFRGDDSHGRDLPHAWPPSPDDMHAWGRVPVEAQPAICRVAHGVPRGVDRRRLKALGNAVVPQVAEVIGRAIEREAKRFERAMGA